MFRHAAIVLFASVCGLTAQAPHFTYPELLARVTDPSWLYLAPAAGERCVQFSSYDRRSDQGPGDAEAWFANGDCGQYLRIDEADGKKEFVMVDTDGPGVVTRLWSANPKGKLFFDVDGQRVWEVDFAQLTRGKLAGLGEPWCGEHSRGCNCYLPIPFGKHLKVSASEDGFYYQVNVVTFAAGTMVPSFSAAMLTEQKDAIAAAGKQLAQGCPPGVAWNSAWSEPWRIEPGSVLLELSVSVASKPEGGDLGQALRDTRLIVRCGKETTVDVPVLDFFNGGPDLKPYRGYLLGAYEGGGGYCMFPMPMPQGGEVLFEPAGGAHGLKLSLGGTYQKLPKDLRDPLLFRASYHLVKNDHTRPFHDHLVLDAKGMGRFCGTSLLVKNPVKAWWGEGDEKFTVDGEKFPSTFGTGTEDYFGYAWCCPEPFSAAFHAQPQCDGPDNYGFTAVNRMQLFDSVPFQNSFHYDLEVWHWADCKVDYATVAYWYGAPGAASGLPAMPAVADRALDRLPPYQVRRVAGAIEGEALLVKECTGGTHEVQDLDDEVLSGGQQRWWKDGKPGDRLVLLLPVPEAGRYQVSAQFCTAADYGIVQVTLAGKPVGKPIDLFHRGIKPSGVLELGSVELPKGDVELQLELTGHNDAAVPRNMVGLDFVKLEKQP